MNTEPEVVMTYDAQNNPVGLRTIRASAQVGTGIDIFIAEALRIAAKLSTDQLAALNRSDFAEYDRLENRRKFLLLSVVNAKKEAAPDLMEQANVDRLCGKGVEA